LLAAAGLTLTVCALVLLVLHREIVLQAGWPGFLTLLAFVALAVTIGHLLGGPSAADRTTLALACGSRHVGVAVAVAASLPGPRTAVLIALYVLSSALICMPYLRWRRAGAQPSITGAES
jgi:BASS family bile acid:Na+ symporter